MYFKHRFALIVTKKKSTEKAHSHTQALLEIRKQSSSTFNPSTQTLLKFACRTTRCISFHETKAKQKFHMIQKVDTWKEYCFFMTTMTILTFFSVRQYLY